MYAFTKSILRSQDFKMFTSKQAIDALTKDFTSQFTGENAEDIVLDPSELQIILQVAEKCLTKLSETLPKQDKSKPKERVRARSAYQIWKSENTHQFRLDNPDISGGPAINKAMGSLWKSLSDQEKTKYVTENAKERSLYPSKESTTKKPKDKKPKKEKQSRKRSKSPYECYKTDYLANKFIQEADSIESINYKDRCLASKNAWEQLSEEERQLWEDTANKEKQQFLLSNKVEEVVSDVINTGLQSASQSLEGTPYQSPQSSTSVTPVTSPRGPSPYQKWKKLPETKKSLLVIYQRNNPDATKVPKEVFKDSWKALTQEERTKYA